jgi:signal transduction histidine kinase
MDVRAKAERATHGIVPLLVIAIVTALTTLGHPPMPASQLTDYLISVWANAVLSALLVMAPDFRGNIVVILLHIAAVLTSIYTLPGDAEATVLLLSLFAFLVVRLYRGAALFLGLLALAVAGVLLSGSRQAWDRTLEPIGMTTIAIYLGVLSVAVTFAGYLRYLDHRERKHSTEVHSLERSLDYLTEANHALQRYALAARTTSAHKERNRISREVHDSIGHVLVNIIMMLEAAREYVARDQVKADSLLREIRDEADLGHREMRRALRELREVGTDEQQEIGYLSLVRLTRVFSAATGITVYLEVGNADPSFSVEFARLLYAFIQEGLTNAVRHGRATEVSISFHVADDTVRVTLRDNGIGMQGPIDEGIGVQGMRERLDACGGSLTIENGPAGLAFTATVSREFAYQGLQE